MFDTQQSRASTQTQVQAFSLRSRRQRKAWGGARSATPGTSRQVLSARGRGRQRQRYHPHPRVAAGSLTADLGLHPL